MLGDSVYSLKESRNGASLGAGGPPAFGPSRGGNGGRSLDHLGKHRLRQTCGAVRLATNLRRPVTPIRTPHREQAASVDPTGHLFLTPRPRPLSRRLRKEETSLLVHRPRTLFRSPPPGPSCPLPLYKVPARCLPMSARHTTHRRREISMEGSFPRRMS